MRALITGITGQDGYFLSQFLLNKEYEVHGIVRRNSSMTYGNLDNLDHNLKEKISLHQGDITDPSFISSIVKAVSPDELYHLAAQSFVGYSFKNSQSTYDINIGGTLNVCNAIKDFSPDTRMYFAASSEMFGQPKVTPQNEQTPLEPRSPYAVSKLAGFWTVRTYREAYDLFLSNGIFFNHESEVRGREFVTRKISSHVARYSKGMHEPLLLGNLNARKDWGYAQDFVDGMWKILNYKYADDFVLGTGELHTVREFVEESFRVIGVEVFWRGSGLNEVGLSEKDEVLVKINKEFFRPLESDNFTADYSKAKSKLGWSPKLKFKDLVKLMVIKDIESIS
jgi:GDPmannose 4,6-dehydratase